MKFSCKMKENSNLTECPEPQSERGLNWSCTNYLKAFCSNIPNYILKRRSLIIASCIMSVSSRVYSKTVDKSNDKHSTIFYM